MEKTVATNLQRDTPFSPQGARNEPDIENQLPDHGGANHAMEHDMEEGEANGVRGFHFRWPVMEQHCTLF
jgi:hypothetical protein